MNKKADLLDNGIVIFVIIITITFIITFYHFFIEKPKIIDHNITIEKEVIKEIEKPCPVVSCPELSCPEVKACPKSNYDREYILRLIREAKRCERNEYAFNISECYYELNNTQAALRDCKANCCRYNSSWC